METIVLTGFASLVTGQDEKGMNASHDCEVYLEVTVPAGY
jgi:hypothetical protein